MKEKRISFMIEQLTKLNVWSGPNGESLISMDYQALKCLLATKKALNE
ncbi:hypothetical protein MKZ20_21885 [Psychrobacillus sp. FSL K6-2684]